VRPGDTLSSVASRYGLTVSELKGLNHLTSDRIVVGSRLRVSGGLSGPPQAEPPVAAPEVAPAAVDGSPRYHRVRAGDSLWDIAKRYGVSVGKLRSWNGLRSNRIYPGMKLRVEAGPERPRAGSSADARRLRHRVRRGETLWSIARRYGVSIRDLARWNKRGTRQTLRAGQRLTVYLPNGV